MATGWAAAVIPGTSLPAASPPSHAADPRPRTGSGTPHREAEPLRQEILRTLGRCPQVAGPLDREPEAPPQRRLPDLRPGEHRFEMLDLPLRVQADPVGERTLGNGGCWRRVELQQTRR